MSRPKGSKNRPKFQQMQFETEGIPDLQLYENSLTQDEVINTMEIKHVLRTINPGNQLEIEQGGGEMKGLNEYFKEGWKLFSTHYAGEEPGLGHRIFYILVREISAS